MGQINVNPGGTTEGSSGDRTAAAGINFLAVVLVLVVALSFADGEYGLPAVTGAAVAIALGPLCYSLARRHARAATVTDPA